jgi:hypothetical protein
MNSLKSPHVNPLFWQKRQQVNDFKKQIPMFAQLMDITTTCMKNNPHLRNDVQGAIQCETIHPQTMSKFTNFTFHTHPHTDIDYPSDVDKQTTNNLNKDWLLIGLPARKTVAVYHRSDNFSKKYATLSV